MRVRYFSWSRRLRVRPLGKVSDGAYGERVRRRPTKRERLPLLAAPLGGQPFAQVRHGRKTLHAGHAYDARSARPPDVQTREAARLQLK